MGVAQDQLSCAGSARSGDPTAIKVHLFCILRSRFESEHSIGASLHINKDLMRLSLTLIAWGVLSNCFAQVKAPSTRIEISRPVQVQDDWVKHRPIVLEDGRILVVECTSHLP